MQRLGVPTELSSSSNYRQPSRIVEGVDIGGDTAHTVLTTAGRHQVILDPPNPIHTIFELVACPRNDNRDSIRKVEIMRGDNDQDPCNGSCQLRLGPVGPWLPHLLPIMNHPPASLSSLLINPFRLHHLAIQWFSHQLHQPPNTFQLPAHQHQLIFNHRLLPAHPLTMTPLSLVSSSHPKKLKTEGLASM